MHKLFSFKKVSTTSCMFVIRVWEVTLSYLVITIWWRHLEGRFQLSSNKFHWVDPRIWYCRSIVCLGEVQMYQSYSFIIFIIDFGGTIGNYSCYNWRHSRKSRLTPKTFGVLEKLHECTILVSVIQRELNESSFEAFN